MKMIFALLLAVAMMATFNPERRQHERPPAAVAPSVGPVTAT